MFRYIIKHYSFLTREEDYIAKVFLLRSGFSMNLYMKYEGERDIVLGPYQRVDYESSNSFKSIIKSKIEVKLSHFKTTKGNNHFV